MHYLRTSLELVLLLPENRIELGLIYFAYMRGVGGWRVQPQNKAIKML